MSIFKPGDIILDSRGRFGVILSCYSTVIGNFYNVLIKGEIFSLSEEEIKLKSDD